MKNQPIKKLIFLLLICLNAIAAIAQDGKFSFTLPSSARTSAGVFKDDSILIKTLWSDEQYSTGNYIKYWDGTDDYGNIIKSPSAFYKVKVLSNNVKYTWQGTIGNSSTYQTGNSKHRGYNECIKGIAFGSTYGYFCTGYSEGSSSIGKFNINTPNISIPLYPKASITGDVNYVATDGIKVYWGISDAFSSNNTFILGTKVLDDSEVSFANGSSYTLIYGNTYENVISKASQINSEITGLAVQKTGNYLFVARAGLNQLQVINKTTGFLMQTLIYSTPKSLSVDSDDNLWMASGVNDVKKYSVNVNGTLASPTTSLLGLSDPLAIQVSNNGTEISVADGAAIQQLKFFSTNTGTVTNVLGIPGGYFTDVNVNNNKFYFNDARRTLLPCIAFQTDGSFWIGDPGNSRVQHYGSDKVFIDRIMFLGSTYSTWADRNNIKRIWNGYQEYLIDYSTQMLTGSAGWSLVKNWGAIVTGKYDDFQKFKFQTTLSNGKTYSFIRNKNDGIYEIVELPANGVLRFTGVVVPYSKILCSDGSLQDYKESGTSATYLRYPLSGFDASNNPVWSGTPEVLAAGILNTSIGSPLGFPNNQIFSTTNKIALYNYGSFLDVAETNPMKGYHLGLMARGTSNVFLFQTEKSTHRNYQGNYPKEGWFDVGNGVNSYSGGNLNIVDRNIITSYHGEFWKGSQTNKYNHYYDNGLAIGQFGTTRPEVGFGNHAAPMMAGNALSPILVKDDSTGNMYLYHGDESDHSGIHRWKISGLNSIVEQITTIQYPYNYKEQTINYIDLMEGLPFDTLLSNNTKGWTRYPTLNSETGRNNWVVKTSITKYDRNKTTDLYVNFSQADTAKYNLSRDLGNNNIIRSWKISGNVALNYMANGLGNNAYMEVLDANNKVLTTVYILNDYSNPIRLFCNDVAVPVSDIPVSILNENTFEIIVDSGIVRASYGGYVFPLTGIFDKAGNWRTPKTFRITFTTKPGYPNFGINYDVSDLKFYKDPSVTLQTNISPIANAGSNIIITLPVNSTTLSGTGTDQDGTISNYAWAKISGPAAGTILTANAANTTVNNLVQGVYQYELTVTDNGGAVGKDTVQVTVNVVRNIAPSANAGSDIIITLPVNSVNLSGSGADTDGTISSYNWVKISGPAAGTIATANAATTVISNLVQGIYQYELTVKDNGGAVGKDTVQVIVNAARNIAPSANAGSNIIITLPVNSTTLSGTGTDPDGTISSYSWVKISGPASGKIVTANTAITVINNLVQGVYQYELTVTDNGSAVGKDTVQVTVNAARNIAPSANAGSDIIITLPVNSANLSGSGLDQDGTISNYSWSKISGPSSGTILNANAANTTINNLVEGIYQYELTVTDNGGAVGKDTVQVNVRAAKNTPPAANAGNDITIVLPVSSATLRGSGTDMNGVIISYAWTKISGPATGMIANANGPVTVINNLVQGVYNFELTVTNNKGEKGKDTVQVTVNQQATINKLPVANAGADLNIVLPVNNAMLNGKGFDPDGSITSYSWKVISGPTGYNFSSAQLATTKINNLFQGIYNLELTVMDDNGAFAKDTMSITVSSPRLSNYTANALTVYPNPVADIANLNINTINAKTKLSIAAVDVRGRLVKYQEMVTGYNDTLVKLDMSTLSNGYYIITLKFDDGRQISTKVIKYGGK